MSPKKKYKKLDYLGITASLICAVHCSVLPIAIGLGFLGSGFLVGHGIFEMVFIGLSMFFAFTSLYQSYQKIHHNVVPFVMFISGLVMIISGLYFHGISEIILATMGGIIIAVSHFYNIRLSQQFNSCCTIRS